MASKHDLAIIDMTLGTELAGGSKDMAMELLIMLKDSLEEHLQSISTEFEQKNHDALSKAVHKLHGAACYTGTPRLRTACKLLEAAAQHQEDSLDEDYAFFIETLEKTRAELDQFNS